MSLPQLRSEIDLINEQLIAMLGKRLAVAKEIAKVKKHEQLPLLDAERELLQLETIRDRARQQSLSVPIIEEFFTLLFEYTRVEMDLEMQR